MDNERWQGIKAEIIKAKKDFIHGIPPRYTLIDNAQELIAALEEAQQELAEAQKTIRIAYSELPHERLGAKATLKFYMSKHKLGKW